MIEFPDASPLADLGPVGVWAAGFGGMRNDTLSDIAAEIEQLGYGSVWFPESPAGEPFVKSALVLAATSTLVAGTGIANLWLRHPLTMTATARALVDAFPQRFLLGVGRSGLSAAAPGLFRLKPKIEIEQLLEKVSGRSRTIVPGN